VTQSTATAPVPLPTSADARNRAWRTLAQGLIVDVTSAVVLAIAPQVIGASEPWTRRYWIALGLLAAKTALQTGVAYWMRHALPPPTDESATLLRRPSATRYAP
jgi:hypothetical protein